MRWEDVPQVMAIERKSFSLPWSDYTYRHEILDNRNAHYFVARRMTHRARRKPVSWWARLFGPAQPATVVGYGGFWIVMDEAHISTIASDDQLRGRGIGELMLLAMIERSIELGAHEVTLEVRVSNTVAQNLYRKYGFEVVGRRPNYYRDNDEDADLMTVFKVNEPAYQARLKALRAALEERLRRQQVRPA
jgi:ribosomal-protein-alanine N-acetyltransferase